MFFITENREFDNKNNCCISGLNYNLEKQEEPSVSIDLDATIASMDTMEFCLVRENSE